MARTHHTVPHVAQDRTIGNGHASAIEPTPHFNMKFDHLSACYMLKLQPRRRNECHPVCHPIKASKVQCFPAPPTTRCGCNERDVVRPVCCRNCCSLPLQ
jgi:hypothetical protein